MWIGLVEPRLPEANALRQAVAAARAGKELEKELCVVAVEAPQSLGPHRQVILVDGAPRPLGEPRLEILGQKQGRGVAICLYLRHGPEADPLELPGNRRIAVARSHGPGPRHLLLHLPERTTPESLRTGEHLVKDDTEGEDIAAGIELLPERLLRAHVGRRAGDLRVGQRFGPGNRDAEVRQIGHAAGVIDEDVCRFDVAVDEAGAVGVGVMEGTSHRGGNPRRLLRRGPAALEAFAERRPVDVLADDENRPVIETSNVIDADEVVELECRRGFRLAQEGFCGLRPTDPFRIRQFDRDRPVELVVPPLPDVAERPSADMVDQTVTSDPPPFWTGRKHDISRKRPLGYVSDAQHRLDPSPYFRFPDACLVKIALPRRRISDRQRRVVDFEGAHREAPASVTQMKKSFRFGG